MSNIIMLGPKQTQCVIVYQSNLKKLQVWPQGEGSFTGQYWTNTRFDLYLMSPTKVQGTGYCRQVKINFLDNKIL